MEQILLEILARLKNGDQLTGNDLAQLFRNHNRGRGNGLRPYAKKHLMPFYLKAKAEDRQRWESWNVDADTERALLKLLQIKPRRTASGVATITVVTKPWKCTSNCLYCPNDLRMPKSYLSDEPACQRAERNYFDPFLQVTSRLRALTHMGHATDKVEIIVLGGTWSDYPHDYQRWFIAELFRALNAWPTTDRQIHERLHRYEEAGILRDREDLAAQVAPLQLKVNAGEESFNRAAETLYERSEPWQRVGSWQRCTFPELEEQQRTNETADHRMVGLVIETRPDTIDARNLTLIRRLGCTKVQMGIQSLDPAVLQANHRSTDAAQVERAFALLRLFGFKLHTHFMVNLLGSTPARDKEDYRRFVTDPAFLPDEVKIYPCSLVDGTGLVSHYKDGSWVPYSEEQLIDVLSFDTTITPPYARISRMIRDISAHDIMAGNKKGNLRQLVEQSIERAERDVSEIRYREISTGDVDKNELHLDEVHYETTVSHEAFLQWVTPDNKIAGFLRLSLPCPQAIERFADELPVGPKQAMIREVHVYGAVAKLHRAGTSAQHLGLGKQLIERACEIARNEGFETMNVISSVGTREYYRKRGFRDAGLYQQRDLLARPCKEPQDDKEGRA